MADIMMCTNEECKQAPTCYRFNAEANEHRQSYMADPKKDCEEQEYEYYSKGTY